MNIVSAHVQKSESTSSSFTTSDSITDILKLIKKKEKKNKFTLSSVIGGVDSKKTRGDF